MNEFFLYEAINDIDEDLIVKANIKSLKSSKIKTRFIGLAAAVFVVMISISAFYNFRFNDDIHEGIVTKDNTSACENTTSSQNKENSSIYYDEKAKREVKLFIKSDQSADKDDYGDDGIQDVDLIIEGVIYHQIDDLDFYSLKSVLKESDFGSYIGTVQELTESNNYNYNLFNVSSHETSLNGAKVYFYSPLSCKAVVIALNNDHCSYFMADNFTDDMSSNFFAEMFSLYGVKNDKDIKKITCQIWDGEYGSDNSAVITEKTITSNESIKEIYRILISDNLSDNQEIIIKDSYSISMSFHLANGLIIGNHRCNFTYMPYNSTGFIEGKGVITSPENEKLKAIFDLK